MNHHRIFLALFLTVWITETFAQTNYQPGFYISTGNDTVYGEIDNRGDLKNGEVCNFRSALDAREIHFAPGDIKAYRFTEGKYYVSREFEIDGEKQAVFAEYLVNGISSLYYFRSAKGDHYFLETANGEVNELTNDDIIVEQNGTYYKRKSNRYIGQLKSSFSDAPELGKKIDHAQFTHKSLISLTSEYHDYVCDGEQCIIYAKSPPAVRIAVGPIIGLTSSGLHFGDYLSYNDYAYTRSMDLLLGFKISISMPRLSEKLSIYFQSEFNKSYFFGYTVDDRFSATTTYKDLHVHLTTLKGLFGLQYTYPKGKIRPTMSLGPMFSFNLDADFKHVDETVSETAVFTRESHYNPLLDENYGAYICLGADWNVSGKHHIELGLRYHFTKETTGNYVFRDGLTLMTAYSF